MEINDEAKEIVQELGAAINSAVENSTEVAAAIERLREYEAEPDEDEDGEGSARLELTDEDRRTLRSMKIRLDDSD